MIEIPLKDGLITTIDDIDADLAELVETEWKIVGQPRNKYVGINVTIDGKHTIIFLHRVILARKLGRMLEQREFCDHIHGNGLDNRRSEIRLASASQNMQNRKMQKNNTSGYRGVHRHKKSGKFQATIYVNNKPIYLGTYNTPEKAYAVYCEAAIKYHGEFANVSIRQQAAIQLPLFDLDKAA